MKRVTVLPFLGLLLGLVATLPNKDDWDIYSFHINSTVTSRYATTVISSRVANRVDESKEIEFHVRIPKNAFITKFRMFMDGEVYDGVVKEKEQAERQYSAAVSRGQSAGIISSVGRTLEEFKTSVNVAAHKKVTFELTYEELLKRRLGKYELQIYARPLQPVKDFKVDVHINEDAGLKQIEIKGGLNTKGLANALTQDVSDKQASITLYPTVDQQKDCNSCTDQGLDGDLVIFYDVKREIPFGDIQTGDGYFVHHFAPSNLPRIPKNVVFVIDQSGSMHGRKMEQTRIALIHILGDLEEDDFFGLITFDGEIFHWKRELVQATSKNIQEAKAFAENIESRGATDINKAVLEGTRMLNVHTREDSASILILLTDGDPTSGETNPERIRTNIRRVIAGKFPLYCLGFGFDVNFQILEKLSLDNNGVARRIYEDSDANLQLQGFYEEVATPLLKDVTMVYIGGSNLTQTNFSQYYNGSELVVAGVITNNDIESFTPEVVALSRNTKVTFSSRNATTELTPEAPVDRIQRVWAYLTVKQLMEKELQLSGPEKEKAKNEAKDLSLKYSFVTPLTSMVVTKPPGEDSAVLNKPKEGQKSGPVMFSRQSVSGASGSIHKLKAQAQPGVYGLQPDRHIPARAGRPAAHPGFARHPGFFSQASFDVPLAHPGFAGPPGHPGASGAGGAGRAGGGRQSSDFYEEAESLIETDDAMMISSWIPGATTTTTTKAHVSPAPSTQRFLVTPTNTSLPLCFDLSASGRLKLLRMPSREIIVDGELSPELNGGFSHIFIRVQSDLRLEMDTESFTVRNDQTGEFTRYTTASQFTVSSAAVIIRDKEIDISVGDFHFVILTHDISGRKFLWPVLKQMPADDTAEGVLVYNNADYEGGVTIGTTSSVNVKGKNIIVSRSRAEDYRAATPTAEDCWLLSAEDAFQKPASEFYN